MRTRAERRHNDWTKAWRKRHISDQYSCWGPDEHWYPYVHQYSKNKIHCSCGMCARYRKTNNKGHRRNIPGNYAPSYNPSTRDIRMNEHVNAMLVDYEESLALAEEENF